MYVVIALAALAILAGVVVLAMGRGGELSEAHPDYPPPLLPTDRRLVGMDAAMLRLPRGLWGYQVDCADEALRMFAYALSERDTRVADLERQVAELRRTSGVPDRTIPEISWLTPPGAPTETAEKPGTPSTAEAAATPDTPPRAETAGAPGTPPRAEAGGPPAGFAHPDPEKTAVEVAKPEGAETSAAPGPEEATESAEPGAESTPSWALPQPPEPWWQSESVTRIPSAGAEENEESEVRAPVGKEKSEDEGGKS